MFQNITLPETNEYPLKIGLLPQKVCRIVFPTIGKYATRISFNGVFPSFQAQALVAGLDLGIGQS